MMRGYRASGEQFGVPDLGPDFSAISPVIPIATLWGGCTAVTPTLTEETKAGRRERAGPGPWAPPSEPHLCFCQDSALQLSQEHPAQPTAALRRACRRGSQPKPPPEQTPAGLLDLLPVLLTQGLSLTGISAHTGPFPLRASLRPAPDPAAYAPASMGSCGVRPPREQTLLSSPGQSHWRGPLYIALTHTHSYSHFHTSTHCHTHTPFTHAHSHSLLNFTHSLPLSLAYSHTLIVIHSFIHSHSDSHKPLQCRPYVPKGP